MIFIVIDIPIMKNKKPKKTNHLVVRVTSAQFNLILKQISKEKGITLSDFVRKSINNQIYNATKK